MKMRLYIFTAILFALLFCACSSSGSEEPVNTSDEQTNDDSRKTPITEESLLGEMSIYYGNLHGHTNYSWPEVKGYTPADSFAYAKDLGLDFCAVTDHDVWLDINLKPKYWLNDKAWKEIGKAADDANADGEFVAIRGFEWSNPAYGHICIFDTPCYTDFLITPFDPVLPCLAPSIYSWIDRKNAIAQFNHPGREEKMFNQFEYDETVADNFVLMETGNKDDGIYTNDYLPNYILALDKGWKLGPAANQDNHVLHINSHRTVIIAPDLTREALFAAFKERRTYATDDTNMRVIFKSGDTWMGSTVITDDDSILLTIMVKDDEPISSLEIITNKGEVAAEKSFSDEETSDIWQVSVPCRNGSYFFLKVIEKDTHNDELINPHFAFEETVTFT
ncbi:MAG TPA: CehA/McbA family metallohydrolase [Desulfomonilia bacterium]